MCGKKLSLKNAKWLCNVTFESMVIYEWVGGWWKKGNVWKTEEHVMVAVYSNNCCTTIVTEKGPPVGNCVGILTLQKNNTLS